MFKIKLFNISAIAIILFFSSCSENTVKVKKFESVAIKRVELANYFIEQNLNITNIDTAIKYQLYFPLDSNCSDSLSVHPSRNFDWLNLKSRLLNGETQGLIDYTQAIYQLFADSKVPEKQNYELEGLSTDNIISKIIYGNWVPQCGGISIIAAEIINRLSDSYYALPVHLNYPEHDICVVFFEKKGILYGLGIDFQNGVLGPLNSIKKAFPAAALDTLNLESGLLYHLPDSILRKKRNLHNELPFCNLFPTEISAIYFCDESSPYQFEILSYSLHYHLWFIQNQISEKDFTEELIQAIKSNAHSGNFYSSSK